MTAPAVLTAPPTPIPDRDVTTARDLVIFYHVDAPKTLTVTLNRERFLLVRHAAKGEPPGTRTQNPRQQKQKARTNHKVTHFADHCRSDYSLFTGLHHAQFAHGDDPNLPQTVKAIPRIRRRRRQRSNRR